MQGLSSDPGMFFDQVAISHSRYVVAHTTFKGFGFDALSSDVSHLIGVLKKVSKNFGDSAATERVG